jgi:RNA polymerase sigma-70 factor (ECF subfamily)
MAAAGFDQVADLEVFDADLQEAGRAIGRGPALPGKTFMETSISLLERLAGQPTDADWRLLLEVYQPLLRAWMARAEVADSDADDLAQEVLLVVFREVGAFERRGAGAFRSWLRTILTHRVRDYFRGQKYRPTATGDSDFGRRLDELESPDSELSRLWDREHDEHVAASLLRRVQGDFAPATWQAFVRHVLEEEPAVKVAEALGVSLNSVLLAKSRVLKRMREEMAGLLE